MAFRVANSVSCANLPLQPLAEAQLLKILAKMNREQILAALDKHSTRVGNFDEELVNHKVEQCGVDELESLERSIQSRLDDLSS